MGKSKKSPHRANRDTLNFGRHSLTHKQKMFVKLQERGVSVKRANRARRAVEAEAQA